MQKKINIAIDGYSSCGKGTLAKALAKSLGYVFIDSGAMYRAVTLHMLQSKVDVNDEAAVVSALANVQVGFENNAKQQSEVTLNGVSVESEIRNIEVASKVSEVAKIAAVRTKMVALQQAIGSNRGVVMDGRDIGTVVFPDAELKIFMTASPEVRAQRRFAELSDKGDVVTLEEIAKNLKHRDTIDASRENSPLTLTGDYRVLDNSDLSKEAQFAMAMGWVNEAIQCI
ncbi:MAG: (d)CMP kinase [Bacteroidetes bacterium]|nr:(d)CMP kinase [Bacteroidota bacterium]NBX63457.1 (d)CMP kinase [Bacteroidota bacterium]